MSSLYLTGKLDQFGLVFNLVLVQQVRGSCENLLQIRCLFIPQILQIKDSQIGGFELLIEVHQLLDKGRILAQATIDLQIIV